MGSDQPSTSANNAISNAINSHTDSQLTTAPAAVVRLRSMAVSPPGTQIAVLAFEGNWSLVLGQHEQPPEHRKLNSEKTELNPEVKSNSVSGCYSIVVVVGKEG